MPSARAQLPAGRCHRGCRQLQGGPPPVAPCRSALSQIDSVQLARGVVASWPYYPSAITALRVHHAMYGGTRGGGQ